MVLLLGAFGVILLTLLFGGNTGDRRRHDSQEEFSPPSALKRIVYGPPACAEATGVFKTHSDMENLKKKG
ncbi:MAG: hypothetical protein KAQ65_01520 [Candidatus Thorarchaeota archaeon]|nr:hypothetical protein [Candidatus Thorarchaeota archaeon]